MVARSLFLTLSLLLAAACSANAQLLPVGAQFQISSGEFQAQLFPDSVRLPDGTHLVVWAASGADGSGRGVLGRYLAEDGSPMAPDFLVNTSTANSQSHPRVAADADGRMLVVWEDHQFGGNFVVTSGRILDASGSPVGSDFILSDATTVSNLSPSVAATGDDDFVVTWADFQRSLERITVAARGVRGGAPVGASFEVSTDAESAYYPDVDSAGDGRFVVVWSEYPGNEDPDVIRGRRYSGLEAPVGAAFEVSDQPGDGGLYPRVHQHGSGEFVVAWASYGESVDVRTRAFSASAAPHAASERLDFDSGLNGLDVAGTADGGSIVLWNVFPFEVEFSTPGQAVARRLDATGTPVGAPLVLADTTLSWEGPAGLALSRSADEYFLAAWPDDPLQAEDVFGRRICDDPDGDMSCGEVVEPVLCEEIVTEETNIILEQLRLTRVNADTIRGNDGLLLLREFLLPPQTDFSSIDPLSKSIRFVIESADGRTLVDETLPREAYSVDTQRGWQVNKRGTKWLWVDKSRSRQNGILRLIVQDRSRRIPNQVKFFVRGRGGDYPVTIGDLPPVVTVIVGDSSLGECAISDYTPPECFGNGSGRKLLCR